MSKRPVYIGERLYPTLGDAKNAVRNVVDSYADGEVVSDPDHIDLLLDVVYMHADPARKIGPGIAEFVVDHVPGTPNRGFKIVHVGGGQTSSGGRRLSDCCRLSAGE